MIARLVGTAMRALRQLLPRRRMRVFVSGATQDMEDFRRTICERSGEWWGDRGQCPAFASMDDAKSEDMTPLQWSVSEAEGADVLVLLLGAAQGAYAQFQPSGTSVTVGARGAASIAQSIPEWDQAPHLEQYSFTQWEVFAACASGTPILVFSPNANSQDSDLTAFRQATSSPNDETTTRQECFAKWIHSQHAATFFDNRVDLTNRLRTALHRRQRCVGWYRFALALALIVGLAVVGSVLPAHRRTAQRKYAFAAGGAVAMLISGNRGGSVFELSLQHLGLPDSVRRTLCARYDDAAALATDGTWNEFQQAEMELYATVAEQLRIVRGEEPIEYLELGYGAVRARILLSNWDALARSESTRAALQEAVGHLKAGRVAATTAGAAVTPLIDQLVPDNLADPQVRTTVLQQIDVLIALHDMQP